MFSLNSDHEIKIVVGSQSPITGSEKSFTFLAEKSGVFFNKINSNSIKEHLLTKNSQPEIMEVEGSKSYLTQPTRVESSVTKKIKPSTVVSQRYSKIEKQVTNPPNNTDIRNNLRMHTNSVSYQQISPSGRNEERYQVVLTSLLSRGIQKERIVEIFSSTKAKQIDRVSLKRISKQKIECVFLKKNVETIDIANKINNHLIKYRYYYDVLEEIFQVNREIAGAVMYKETHLGQFRNWKHESFIVLNSLLGYIKIPTGVNDMRQRLRIKRIISMVQKSMVELILYCETYKMDILNTRFNSSYSGAIGIPQFMPMHLDLAISYDNMTPDLEKVPDAILSFGNIMKNRFEWPGLMDLRKLVTIDDIIEKYIKFDRKKRASLCFSADLEGYPLYSFKEEFEGNLNLDYINEYCASIMNYHFSSAYTLDVLQYAYYASILSQ